MDAALWSQLGGMFLAAFGAATILPFQSEVVFAGIQIAGSVPLTLLIVVASVGNILGAVVNYFLGLGLEKFQDRRWFPVKPAALNRARGWYSSWGVWTLLLSWAPLGDAFTVIAGVMRTPFWLFVLLVSIAKTGRYLFLAWATAQVMG